MTKAKRILPYLVVSSKESVEIADLLAIKPDITKTGLIKMSETIKTYKMALTAFIAADPATAK